MPTHPTEVVFDNQTQSHQPRGAAFYGFGDAKQALAGTDTPIPILKINFSLTISKLPLVCSGHPFSSHGAFDRFNILEDDVTVTIRSITMEQSGS